MDDKQVITTPVQEPQNSASTIPPTVPMPPAPPAPPAKRGQFIAGVLLVIGLVGTAFYFRFVRTQKPIVVTPEVEVSADESNNRMTTITVDTTDVRVIDGQVTVPVLIDTEGNTLTAVELHITHDPAEISGIDILPGAFFDNPTELQKQVGDPAGTILYTLGTLIPKQGTGQLVVLTWPKTNDEVSHITITLEQDTQAAAVGETGTVIKEVFGGTITY